MQRQSHQGTGPPPGLGEPRFSPQLSWSLASCSPFLPGLTSRRDTRAAFLRRPQPGGTTLVAPSQEGSCGLVIGFKARAGISFPPSLNGPTWTSLGLPVGVRRATGRPGSPGQQRPGAGLQTQFSPNQPDGPRQAFTSPWASGVASTTEAAFETLPPPQPHPATQLLQVTGESPGKRQKQEQV